MLQYFFLPPYRFGGCLFTQILRMTLHYTIISNTRSYTNDYLFMARVDDGSVFWWPGSCLSLLGECQLRWSSCRWGSVQRCPHLGGLGDVYPHLGGRLRWSSCRWGGDARGVCILVASRMLVLTWRVRLRWSSCRWVCMTASAFWWPDECLSNFWGIGFIGRHVG